MHQFSTSLIDTLTFPFSLHRLDHHSLALHAPDLAIGQNVRSPGGLAACPPAGDLAALQVPEQLLSATAGVAIAATGAFTDGARPGPCSSDRCQREGHRDQCYFDAWSSSWNSLTVMSFLDFPPLHHAVQASRIPGCVCGSTPAPPQCSHCSHISTHGPGF